MITIDEFKRAFAGAVSPDLVAQRDQEVTAALKNFSQAVGGAAEPARTQEFMDRLLGLVQRFDEVKKSDAPAKERLAALDDILQQANTGVHEVTQSIVGLAGQSSTKNEPSHASGLDIATTAAAANTSRIKNSVVNAGTLRPLYPPIPRKPIKRKAPNPGSGGDTGDDSSITFDGRAILFVNAKRRSASGVDPRGIIEIDAGESGTLSFFLDIKGLQDNWNGNHSFTYEVEGTWDVSADKKGALKITRNPGVRGALTSSNATDYKVQQPTSVEEEAKGMITIPILVLGKSTSTSSTAGISGELGGKKGGISGGYESNTTDQTSPDNVFEQFSIKINVVNIPKEPDPTGTVKIGDVTAIVDGEFAIGPFVTGLATKLDTKVPFNPGSATHLKASSVEKAVYDLFYSLPEGTRESVLNGKLAGEEAGVGMLIETHGYASNTDTEKRNYALSLERAEAVKRAFMSLGVPDSVFRKPQPHGEWEVRDDKGMEPTDIKKREKESADWRKVVIKMRYTVTTESGE